MSITTTAEQHPSLTRLTRVELRKSVDTRSGFWLAIAVGLLFLAVALIAAANHGGLDATYTHTLHAAVTPGVLLLPVVGILLVCAEWTQRTTLTTFTLVPDRGRVIAAKLVAALIIATLGLIACLLCTILAVAACGHHAGGAGSLGWQVIGQTWVDLGASMVMGLGFGAAILLSAPAIVAFLLAPNAFAALTSSFHALNGVDSWLDSTTTLGALTQGTLDGTQWLHALATIALWAGIPIAVGVARIGRGDID